MDQLEDTPLPSNLAAVVAELIGELDGLAPLLQSCKCDPNAALQYDMLADALYWSDEYPAALPCDAAFRYLLRYRTMVIMNESANSTLQELWNQAKERFADWPGFAAARTQANSDLQNFYTQKCERAMRELEEADGE